MKMKAKPLYSLLCSYTGLAMFCSGAMACPSLGTAKTFYSQGDTKSALAALTCLEAKYPQDLDVKRLISDIEWWQGDAAVSALEAESAEKLNPWQADPGTAIHLAERAHPWRLTATLDEVWGKYQNGPEYLGILDYRFESRDHVHAGYSRLSRNYDDGTGFDDRVFHLGYARVQGTRSYIETDLTYSPDHNFSPQYSVGIEPHYELGDDSDVSLLLKYLRYIPEDALELAPSWRKIYGLWTFTARLILIEADGVLPSLQASAGYFLDPKTEAALSYSFGRALEAPYLKDGFNSAGAVLTRYLNPALAVSLRGSIYRANLYSENRVAMGADWFF
jgi:YaiO family outer membrane protein